MSALRELQQAFLDAVLLDDDSRIAPQVIGNGMPAARRLAIYRNNAQEGFLKALAATFPVVARLAGDGWFRQTGLEYMRSNPSRSGDLQHLGKDFPAYLQAKLGCGDYQYFADVARLERAYQDVLVASEAPCLDIAALGSVDPRGYAELRFTLHPALRMVESPFPILEIWKANQPDSREAPPICLTSGPSRVLVVRREEHVLLRELRRSDFALLAALAHGEPLGAAADAALQADSQADLGAALSRLITLQTLVAFCTDTTRIPSTPEFS